MYGEVWKLWERFIRPLFISSMGRILRFNQQQNLRLNYKIPQKQKCLVLNDTPKCKAALLKCQRAAFI